MPRDRQLVVKEAHQEASKGLGDNCEQQLPTINNSCQQQMRTINNDNNCQQHQQSEKAVGGSGRKGNSDNCQQQMRTINNKRGQKYQQSEKAVGSSGRKGFSDNRQQPLPTRNETAKNTVLLFLHILLEKDHSEGTRQLLLRS